MPTPPTWRRRVQRQANGDRDQPHGPPRFADCLVVDVDAEHGIAARLLANLVDCLSWAAARPPTLSRAGAKWSREDVRAGDGLADHEVG